MWSIELEVYFQNKNSPETIRSQHKLFLKRKALNKFLCHLLKKLSYFAIECVKVFNLLPFSAFFYVCELFRQLNPEELRMEFPLLVSFHSALEWGKILTPLSEHEVILTCINCALYSWNYSYRQSLMGLIKSRFQL